MGDDQKNLSEVVYRSLSIEKPGHQLLRDITAEEKKSSWFLYVSAIIANLSVFCLACGFGWTSSALQMLQSTDPSINPLRTPVTPIQESWIASLYQLGAAVGPLIAGKLSDIFGRKKLLLFISVPEITCLLIICFATDVRIFYVCRFITGLVLGTTFAVIPVYLSEISEVHNRGTVISIMGVSMNLGVFYCLMLGPMFSLKILTFLCALPLFLFIIFFGLFIPESPVFLASVGKRVEALEALQQLRGTDNVYEEFQNISTTLQSPTEHKNGPLDIFKERVLRKASIVTIGLVFALQFAGINPILAYLETILKSSGSDVSVKLSVNLIGGINVIGTLVTALLIEKLGRKLLLILSTLGCVFSFVILTLYFYLKESKSVYDLTQVSWLPFVCLLSYIIAFSLGLSSLPFTVMGEIFPHRVKSIGTSMGSFTNFFISFFITLAFRIVMDQYGLAACFLILSGSMLLVFFFIYLVVPETKGKSELEIQQMLKE